MRPRELHSSETANIRKAVSMYILPRGKRLLILHMLVEGTSIRSAERLTRVHRDTIMRLMVKSGNQCQAMLDRWMRNLTLRHLELDEIWTYVERKQARVPVTNNNQLIGDQYLFIAIDQDTKLI